MNRWKRGISIIITWLWFYWDLLCRIFPVVRHCVHRKIFIRLFVLGHLVRFLAASVSLYWAVQMKKKKKKKQRRRPNRSIYCRRKDRELLSQWPQSRIWPALACNKRPSYGHRGFNLIDPLRKWKTKRWRTGHAVNTLTTKKKRVCWPRRRPNRVASVDKKIASFSHRGRQAVYEPRRAFNKRPCCGHRDFNLIDFSQK